jgi:uncharacterized protein YlxW (UPF0749 family)
MGLLDYLVATAIDGDYAAAAARDEAPRPEPRRLPPHGWTALALGLFALLLGVAAAQSARAEPTRQQSRASLVSEARSAQQDLTSARREVAGLRREVARQTAERNRLLRRLGTTGDTARRNGAAAGTVPVTGPGMTVTVDDKPGAQSDRERVFDQDLQKLVNGLWAAGAEAVSVNGQRLTALSAIRLAGQAITVNFRSLRPPYVVSAVGNPDELPARFVDTDGGVWWLNLKGVYGLRFDLSSADTLRLPAIRPPLLRFAEAPTPSERDQRPIDPSHRPSAESSGGSS